MIDELIKEFFKKMERVYNLQTIDDVGELEADLRTILNRHADERQTNGVIKEEGDTFLVIPRKSLLEPFVLKGLDINN